MDEREIIDGQKSHNVKAFKALFMQYYREVVDFAVEMHYNEKDAKTEADKVFCRYWEGKLDPPPSISLLQYLRQQVIDLLLARRMHDHFKP